MHNIDQSLQTPHMAKTDGLCLNMEEVLASHLRFKVEKPSEISTGDQAA